MWTQKSLKISSIMIHFQAVWLSNKLLRVNNLPDIPLFNQVSRSTPQTYLAQKIQCWLQSS